uniref:CCHC-type domain-containing protein n=1 Tax=Oryza glumipatula TaxID=40148 RepID=A0A0E0AU60_9ORYZ
MVMKNPVWPVFYQLLKEVREETRTNLEESRKRFNRLQGGALQRPSQNRMTRTPSPNYRAQHPPPPRANLNPTQMSCYNCGGNHLRRNCPQNNFTCYHCDQIGHTRPNFPWKNLPSEAAKTQAAGQSKIIRALPSPQQNRGGVPVRGGFQNRGGFQARGGQPGNQTAARGRVNHVTIKEAEEATDVIVGKFPVNSEIALVLFDLELPILLFRKILS